MEPSLRTSLVCASKTAFLYCMIAIYTGTVYWGRTGAGRAADRDKPRFTVRMVRVGDGCGTRIAEDSGRFLKRHAVFLHVCAFLLLVPLKLHSCNLAISREV